MQNNIKIRRGLVETGAGYIHYREAGQGDHVLVILNASGQSSSVSIELINRVAPHMRAIAIDYPSHGMSDHVASPRIADYAQWVLEALDQLGVQRAHFTAEATGNGVILEIARSAPARIVKAILVNCPFHRTAESSHNAHDKMKTELRPVDPSGFPLPRTVEYILANDATHSPVRPTQSWMDRINVAQAEANRDRFQLLDAFATYDLLDAFTTLKCPTLQLMGEKFHYNQFRSEYERLIPNLRFEIIKGGRFCSTWEFADLVGDRIIEFVKQ